jgi:hypothetical protein
VAFRGIIYSYPIRVVFKKDVDIPLLGSRIRRALRSIYRCIWR